MEGGRFIDFIDFIISRQDTMLELGLAHAAVVGVSVVLASVIGITLVGFRTVAGGQAA